MELDWQRPLPQRWLPLVARDIRKQLRKETREDWVQLNNASLCHQLPGPPKIDEATLMEMVANWIEGEDRIWIGRRSSS